MQDGSCRGCCITGASFLGANSETSYTEKEENSSEERSMRLGHNSSIFRLCQITAYSFRSLATCVESEATDARSVFNSWVTCRWFVCPDRNNTATCQPTLGIGQTNFE